MRISPRVGQGAIAIREVGGRLVVEGQTAAGLLLLGSVDMIIAATGQRPDPR
jgi:hypothetical protein